jgi:hypothetical protein
MQNLKESLFKNKKVSKKTYDKLILNNVNNFYEKINFSQDDKVFDLVEQVVLAGGYGVNNSVPKLWGVSAINAEEPYKYTIKEAPEIQQFDLLDIKNVVKDDSNYICFVVRQRDWCDHRNLSQDQINKCLE